MIVIILYGLKYRGNSWRAMLAETLGKDGLGYTSTTADKDVLINREVLPDKKYY